MHAKQKQKTHTQKKKAHTLKKNSPNEIYANFMKLWIFLPKPR